MWVTHFLLMIYLTPHFKWIVEVQSNGIDNKIEREAIENAGCVFCQKPNPSKKCSKSHSRCKGKLFCDKTGFELFSSY